LVDIQSRWSQAVVLQGSVTDQWFQAISTQFSQNGIKKILSKIRTTTGQFSSAFTVDFCREQKWQTKATKLTALG